jgi:hypothetical protein
MNVTAPPQEGEFVVRATTSTTIPARSSTAQVIVREEFCEPPQSP